MKKLISFLLVCVLLCGVLPATVPVSAAADDQTPTATENGGLKLNKTAEYDDKTGEYWITLESYATGASTVVNTAAPVDFVLVLDQSGSMAGQMSKDQYNAYTGDQTKNSYLYSKRHNNGNNQSNRNLYYKDGSTYYPVYVERTQVYTYTPISKDTTNTEYYAKRNNLYADANGQTKVTMDWDLDWGGVKYTYTCGRTEYTSMGRETVPNFVTDGSYTFYERSTVNKYTYTYTKNGESKTIGESIGDNTLFSSATLYSYTEDTSATRLDSLISAANSFANTVHKKAVDDKLDHRVAVVGFASNTTTYKNTEVLTGVTINQENKANKVNSNHSANYWGGYWYYPDGYAHNGTQYDDLNINAAYKSALQHMNTDSGYGNVQNAIKALTAHGGTQTDHGLAMAKGIYDQNPIKEGENRKRVVVLLTDGLPTGIGNEYSQRTFSDANATASTLKGSQYNALIYTIGIFDGADATQAGSVGDGASDAQRGNYVCQQLSSNNGTPPQNGAPSYYLSASTQEALNQIFQKIAGELKTDTTASTELGTSTTIQDAIAPQFQLPAGFVVSKVELKTYACTGVGSDGNPTFSLTPNKVESGEDDVMGAEASVDKNGRLNVSGFDYKENWCGLATNDEGEKEPHGNKLVIRFPLDAKAGFLGGNDVYTNTEAKVYASPEDAAMGENPVGTFPRPQVNVPIKDVTVTATDKNVYLLGELSAEQIKSGATVKCGDVSLDLTKADYGLESWQTEYVNITVTYTDASGNSITELKKLQDDTTYTVTATVSPETNGSSTTQGTVATEKTNNATGKINVFTPQLTFKDSEVWYGDNAPTDYTGNKDGEAVWKHGDTLSTAATMIGTAPTLDLTYTPDATKLANGKINSKSDIPVDVTVKIGATDVTTNTDFKHTNCTGKTCTVPSDKEFLLHVKTCTLTITKAAGENTTIGNDEYFVFTVKKDGEAYTQVTIQGEGSVTIKELPVGNYTIEEDTSVAWRYDKQPTITGNGVLSSTNPNGNLTCTNTKTTGQWLNDFTRAINTFGESEPTIDGNK